MDKFALILIIIGGIAWGAMGIFGLNPVAWLVGASMSTVSRVIYTIIGLAGIWSIKYLFREWAPRRADHHRI